MEKATIFSQVPRPPKQIFEEDAAVETVIKTQVTTTENDEKPSAITIMQPKVEVAEKDANNGNKQENIAEDELAVSENSDLGDESDTEPTAVIEAATDAETPEYADLPHESEQDLTNHLEPEADITFEEKETLGDKSDEEPTAVIAAATEEETQESENFENRSEATNDSKTEENKDLEDDFTLEITTDIEPVTDFLQPVENEGLEDEMEDIKMEDEVKELKVSMPKNTNLAEPAIADVKMPNDEDLFKRQYYTMGEVATMFNANQSQIRFWENEFDILKPKKNKKGDRYFRPEDVKNLQLIHHLLRSKKFTIEGANEYLKNNKQRATDTIAAVESLQQLKSFLIELKANL